MVSDTLTTGENNMAVARKTVQDPLIKEEVKTSRAAPTQETLDSLSEGEETSKGTLRGKTITKTAGGKELRVRKTASGMAQWEIVFYPGGEVPNFLKGGWTSESMALRRIELYLNKQKK